MDFPSFFSFLDFYFLFSLLNFYRTFILYRSFLYLFFFHLIMNIIIIVYFTEVQFKFNQPKPPESVCSLPCERGQAKRYVEGESCCWHCFNCSMYQVIFFYVYVMCSICILKRKT